MKFDLMVKTSFTYILHTQDTKNINIKKKINNIVLGKKC